MRKYCSDKDINNRIRNLLRQGVLFRRGGKHNALILETGVIRVPCSPSDHRAFKNFESDVRRHLRKDQDDQ